MPGAASVETCHAKVGLCNPHCVPASIPAIMALRSQPPAPRPFHNPFIRFTPCLRRWWSCPRARTASPTSCAATRCPTARAATTPPTWTATATAPTTTTCSRVGGGLPPACRLLPSCVYACSRVGGAATCLPPAGQLCPWAAVPMELAARVSLLWGWGEGRARPPCCGADC
jgi:hypothetical protein